MMVKNSEGVYVYEQNIGPCPECGELMDFGDLAATAKVATVEERVEEARAEGVCCTVCVGYDDHESNVELAEIRGCTEEDIRAKIRRSV